MIILSKGTAVATGGIVGELNARGFGEMKGNKLILSPEEILYLMEKRKRFPVQDEKGNQLTFDEILTAAARSDKSFLLKYTVYKDLKDRGYIVKTGFKFGTHYRIYPRGVKPGEGHAVWLVHVIKENKKIEFPELSRSVRLAQNVRKKMVFAVVDNEGDVTYYKVERFTP